MVQRTDAGICHYLRWLHYIDLLISFSQTWWIPTSSIFLITNHSSQPRPWIWLFQEALNLNHSSRIQILRKCLAVFYEYCRCACWLWEMIVSYCFIGMRTGMSSTISTRLSSVSQFVQNIGLHSHTSTITCPIMSIFHGK